MEPEKEEREEFRKKARERCSSKKYICSSCGKKNLLVNSDKIFTPIMNDFLNNKPEILGYQDSKGLRYSREEGKAIMNAVCFGGSNAIRCKKCGKFFCDECFIINCPSCKADKNFKESL